MDYPNFLEWLETIIHPQFDTQKHFYFGGDKTSFQPPIHLCFVCPIRSTLKELKMISFLFFFGGGKLNKHKGLPNLICSFVII